MIRNLLIRICRNKILQPDDRTVAYSTYLLAMETCWGRERNKDNYFSWTRRLRKKGNRFASTYPHKLVQNHNNLKFLPEKEFAPFLAHLPKIVADACHKDAILDYQPINERLGKLLNYYGPHGKFLRQHVLIYVYKKIEQHYGTFDEKKMGQVYNVGWCLEMLNIQFMIIDDLLDNHEIRRGRKAWYKQDDVGLSVIMDAYLLQTSMFHLLKKYFSTYPCYTKILENFARLDLAVSLLLELYSKNFEDFTTERYYGIAQTKCTYYILGQPIQLATLLSNKGFQMSDMMQKVFEHFGFLYAMQNDILDCYGEEFGAKPGTDIQERRCTVLILAALRKASPGQRKQLEECYGVKDDEKIKKVKQLYEELDVLGECYKLEKKLYDGIRKDMKNIPDDFTRSIMENLAYVYTFGEIGKPLS